MPKLDLTKPPMTAEESQRLLNAEDGRLRMVAFWKGFLLFLAAAGVFVILLRGCAGELSAFFH
ncbi:hypothetical protein ACTPOE_05610 [Castellaniella sp. WN]